MIRLLLAVLSVVDTGRLVFHGLRQDLVFHPNWELISEFQDECGESTADRIIGGINATLGQYPWIARLGYSYETDPEEETVDIYECGGAIITDRYILTAAHCGPDIIGVKLLQVRLGEYNTETDPDCMDNVCAPAVQDVKVESVICHKSYNSHTFHDDICLVRLKKRIKFNNYVQPICLPVQDIFLIESFEKMPMEVAGWGIYDMALGQPNTILQTVKVPVTDQEKCQDIYKGRADIVNNQFCAGGIIGKDSCSGDSGGPLMAPFSLGAPPKYFVLGVVSFGPTRCGETDSPGVYSKVSAYMTWILDALTS